ncbi:MAG: DUF4091 domain-containing protein [Ruminococcaceae bacterium]|nr:DUF4091 domain-containing protein [Oscillospiraceae bacterium]
MLVKFLSSLEKAFMDGGLSSTPETTKATALKGESFSCQVAIYTNQPAVRCTTYFDIESDIKEYISVRRVRHVPVSTPVMDADENYLRDKPGMFPDVLEPFNTEKFFYVTTGNTETFWLTVENAPAGKHYIKARMLNANKNVAMGSADFELEIIDAQLPEQDIMVTNWFHFDCLATYYNTEVFSEYHWEILENFVKSYVKNGMNMILTPVITPELDTAVGQERPTVQLVDITLKDGKYRYGFKKLDRWVNLCLKHGIKYFEIAHLFSQWGAKAAPKVMATVDGEYKQIFGWDTCSTGPEYKRFLRSFMTALVHHLKALGVDKQCIFHISDEPKGDDALKTYKACRRIVQSILKDYIIMDALSDFEFYKKGAVTTPVVCNDRMIPFLEAKIPGLWTYYCCSQTRRVSNQFISMPSARNRIIATQFYKFDIAGFLQWGFNFYYSQLSQYPINPYLVNDCDGAFTAGDPFKVYPAIDGTALDSIRVVVFAEALQDLRAMKLLESLTSREFVLNLIDEDAAKPVTFTEYPLEASYILNLREKINLEIKKALKK